MSSSSHPVATGNCEHPEARFRPFFGMYGLQNGSENFKFESGRRHIENSLSTCSDFNTNSYRPSGNRFVFIVLNCARRVTVSHHRKPTRIRISTAVRPR